MRALLFTGISLLVACSAFAQDTEPMLAPGEFPPNSVWFIDPAVSTIRGFGIDGSELTQINGFASAPLGMAFGPNGRLYVTSSTGPHDVVVLDYLGNASFFGGSSLVEPRGIAFGPMGRIYVADYQANSIVEFDSDGNFVRSITSSDIQLPTAVAVGTDGHLFVASNGNAKILEIDPERGVVDEVSIDLIPSLTIDAQGILWAVRATDGVYAFDDNSFTTVAHYSGTSFSNSLGVTIGPDYRRWIAMSDRLVATTDGSTYDRTIGASTGLANIYACAFAPFHFRVKLKAKAVDPAGKVSNTEFIDVRFAPGSNSTSIVYTDVASDTTDLASWVGQLHGHFIGMGTFTAPSGSQYQFRGVQQRTPARQSGADSLWITFKGTVGSYDEFRVTNRGSGTLDITYPTFQVHGTFK